MEAESGGRGSSSIAQGLAVLALFENVEVLDAAEIARLTGASRSTVHDCLVNLSRFGYLIGGTDGGYQLAGESAGLRARRGEDGTASSPA